MGNDLPKRDQLAVQGVHRWRPLPDETFPDAENRRCALCHLDTHGNEAHRLGRATSQIAAALAASAF
ncbi:hypothetical protein GL300_22290 [Paracoccus litorisediminis]|uniref:Uncharacterized protein n=1 Tax=Paracoccus litorisediminis TaxID=2006130 RepID=A0A844HPW0_9RHOB|nr:hypothetical protein [Paracoccus litorisediminis]